MAKRRQPRRDGNKPNNVDRVERERYLNRLEHKMLRGVTSRHDLAAAFGKSIATIEDDMAIVRRRWLRNSPTDVEAAKIARIRQFENLAMLAIESYQRSRQDAEEVTVTERPCLPCSATGKVKKKGADGKEEMATCLECGGKGATVVETRRMKGQAGDAGFLRTARDCFVEAAKIEGVIVSSSLTMRNLTQTINGLPDGQVKMEAQELTLEAPIDVLLRSMAVLEEIREGHKSGKIKMLEGKGKPDPQIIDHVEDEDADDE
jgi:hypothetical protein